MNSKLGSDQYGSGATGEQDNKGKDANGGKLSKDASGEKGKNKKKVGSKKTQKKAENIEETFQIPNTLTPPPLELPATSRRDLEKDTASARDRKQQEGWLGPRGPGPDCSMRVSPNSGFKFLPAVEFTPLKIGFGWHFGSSLDCNSIRGRLKLGFHIVVSVVSVLSKKFLRQIQPYGNLTHNRPIRQIQRVV